jgi:hypothetical protein
MDELIEITTGEPTEAKEHDGNGKIGADESIGTNDKHAQEEEPMDVQQEQHDDLENNQTLEEEEQAPAIITATRKTAVSAPDQLFLELLPSSAIPPHQSVFVNDPKLTDLKQLLAASGFHAEFHSGVLYVSNIASVRRNEAGRFHVEGYACADYFRIRDLVYAQFAIV